MAPPYHGAAEPRHNTAQSFSLGCAFIPIKECDRTGRLRSPPYLAGVPVTMAGCRFNAMVAADGVVVLPSAMDRHDAASRSLRDALSIAARAAGLQAVVEAWDEAGRIDDALPPAEAAEAAPEGLPAISASGVILASHWGDEAARGNAAQCDAHIGPFQVRVRIGHWGRVSGHQHLTTAATSAAVNRAVRGAVLAAVTAAWAKKDALVAVEAQRHREAVARDRESLVDWLAPPAVSTPAFWEAAR